MIGRKQRIFCPSLLLDMPLLHSNPCFSLKLVQSRVSYATRVDRLHKQVLSQNLTLHWLGNIPLDVQVSDVSYALQPPSPSWHLSDVVGVQLSLAPMGVLILQHPEGTSLPKVNCTRYLGKVCKAPCRYPLCTPPLTHTHTHTSHFRTHLAQICVKSVTSVLVFFKELPV